MIFSVNCKNKRLQRLMTRIVLIKNVKKDIRVCKNNRKIIIEKRKWLQSSFYFYIIHTLNLKFIAISLSKSHDLDPKSIQQINSIKGFVQDGNKTQFFVLK